MRVRGFEFVKNAPSDLMLPKRKTKGSGAYDFVLPENVLVGAKCFSKKIPLYVKCYMPEDECLELFIRSSVALKKHCWLPTGVSIVDSDYYNCEENEGNINLVIYNAGDEAQFFEKGERIIQGKFSKYLVTDDDNATGERVGGIGSTDKHKMDEKQYYDNHYAEMLVQPIEVMQRFLSQEQFIAALLFNVNKYNSRAGHKAGETISKDEAKRDRYLSWLYEVEYHNNTVIDPKKDYDLPEWFKNNVLDILNKKRIEMENERKQNGKKI